MAIRFWLDKRNLHPITMLPHRDRDPNDEEESIIKNKRKTRKKCQDQR